MRMVSAVSLSLLSAAWALAGDWPQWRGPNRDGRLPDAVAPWPKAGPKLLWKAPVGEGHASPVIVAGKVIVHHRDRDEVVSCFEAATGKPLWEHRYHAPFANPFGAGPRSTPAVDGKRVYTLGVTGILHCLNLDDGKPHWDVRMLEDFHAANLFFGVSTSPLIDGPRVLVNIGGEKASVVAIDKESGKTLWKSGEDRASYASPLIIGKADDRQAVFVTFREVAAYRPASGDKLWSIPLKAKRDENAITPIAAGDGVIVSSVSGGLRRLRPTSKDGKPAVETVWHTGEVSCYFSTPVAVGEHLYAIHGGPFAKLSCIEIKTGKIVWSEPTFALAHASLINVAGRLLSLNDGGILRLIDPSPAGYKELAQSVVCGVTWVHPALADGRLFVKDAEGLKCYELPAK